MYKDLGIYGCIRTVLCAPMVCAPRTFRHVCLRDSQWRHLDSISSKGPLIDVIATEQCVSVERIGNKCCNLHSGVVALFSKIE
jgi:hypothetical protein